MSDENKEKYHLGDYKLIQYQILQTNRTRTVLADKEENYYLGVKGLTEKHIISMWHSKKSHDCEG